MKQYKISFTLAILIFCPAICCASFLVNLKILAPAGAVILIAYIIAFRPAPRAISRTLSPSLVYFIVLFALSAVAAIIKNRTLSAWRIASLTETARIALGIAVSSLVSTASYTLTTDIGRREALAFAEESIRRKLHLAPYPLLIAPALSLLSSFIPLSHRVWSEVDEARKARSMRLITPAMLVTFITVCMQKAVGTGETIKARE